MSPPSVDGMEEMQVESSSPMDVDVVEERVVVDMGYEDPSEWAARQQPLQHRRGSMSADEEKQRRSSIKAIMADNNLSPLTKRRSIQHLMDGRRNSIEGGRRSSLGGGSVQGGGSVLSSTASTGSCTTPNLSDTEDVGDMGYETQHCHPVTAPDGYSISNEQTRRAEQTRPPCSHYERKCTMVAPCCGAAFGCRICHDDCPVLPPKINNGGRRYHRSASLPGSFTSMENNQSHDPQDTHHTIDRFAVREVICRECFTRQSSKTNRCISCNVQFGAYHCSICNLWMSDEERPYHCEDCGFCRVGGAENFQHCHSCGMCIDKTLYGNHNCKSGKYKSNCPVCQEYLFSSRSASHEMPCGHAIHWDCFRQLAAHDSRCPVCKKTAETKERMMPTWNAMASGVALQPVPAELARVVNITCNDCEQSEDNRAWHFLGVQCHHCQSFNTVVDRIVLTGSDAHEFLERNRQYPDGQPVAAQGEASSSQPRRRRMNRRRSAF